MEHKVSKAQEEVWQWKEAAYQQIKDIPYHQRVQFIIDETKDIVAQLKEKKPQAKPSREK